MTSQPSPNLPEPSTGPSHVGVALFKEYTRPALPPNTTGRFTDIKWLGEGGMGVIYSAHDTTLNRKVAIKVLRSSGEDAGTRSTRLLHEGQALAKLQHPNIVGIHDAQQDGDDIWLSMEFVDGVTLHEWLATSRRSWSDIVRVVACVARGLAAAHAAGLVHCDVKPTNVMIDKTGRVFVMDFGLVRSNAASEPEVVSTTAEILPPAQPTSPVAPAGTPAYMAPEQWANGQTDHYTDQFALCLLLWEALYEARAFDGMSIKELAVNVCAGRMKPPPRRPHVPSWLHKTMVRGLSTDQKARFPSMDALADALEHGHVRTRNRRIWLGLGVVGVASGLALGVQFLRHVRQIATCNELGTEMAEVWNPTTKARVQDALLATNLNYAATTFDKLQPWLDGWTNTWSQARTQACRDAMVEDALPEYLYERAVTCLNDQKEELRSLIGVFTTATPPDVQNAVRAASRLSLVASCIDRGSLERQQMPADDGGRQRVAALRADLRRARGLELVGRYESGLELAEEALVAAEGVGHLPTIVEARYVVGRLAGWNSKFDRAEDVLMRGFTDAGSISADEVAARSASELAYTVGYEATRAAEGAVWAQAAMTFARRIGQAEGLLGAEILSNQGSVEQARGNYSEAQTFGEQALAIQLREFGPSHPTPAFTLNNIANALNAQGQFGAAAQRFEEALVIIEETYGSEHPFVGYILNNLAGMKEALGAPEEAIQLGKRARAIQEAALGPQDLQVAFTLTNLGNAASSLEHFDEARAYTERALSIQEAVLGTEHPVTARTLSILGSYARKAGKLDEAEALQAKALETLEATLGPDHPEVGRTLVSLGLLREGRNDLRQARTLYERARSIFEKATGPTHFEIGTVLSDIANLDEEEGNYEAAQHHYEEAMAIKKEAVGESHPDIAGLLMNLGILDIRRERFESAQQQFEKALAIYGASLGADSVEVGRTLINFATCLQKTGRHREAWEHLERARRIYTSTLGADHPSTMYTFVGLGISGVALGRASEVLPLLEQAVKHRDEQPATAEERLLARFTLAQALWDAPEGKGRDRARARRLAVLATAESADLRGAQRDALAEVKAWLRTHR